MPERTWSGYRSEGSSGCDGSWEPKIWTYSCFEAENLSKEDYRKRQPELCFDCVIMLLEKQISDLKAKSK